MKNPATAHPHASRTRRTDRSARGLGLLDDALPRHLPSLQGYVRHRMNGLIAAKESSSDLVQSVCREVVQHLDRFRHGGEDAFRHWLFRTADRKIIDRHRFYNAERRAPARETDDDDPVPANGSSPSRHAAAREELQHLQDVLLRMAPHHREVIVLTRVAGMSYRDIARLLDLSEAAVRQRLHRALAELALLVDGDD